MFSFREDKHLMRLIRAFYESERPVAALCHGVAALMDVKLSDPPCQY
jgi:putative intracellular protease/amidase